jgi:hypothetical protein
MGGRGGSSGIKNVPSGMTPLQAFKENAKQFNEALKKAQSEKASVVEFTDITGATVRRYWNGATFVDRKSALYTKAYKGKIQGTYKANFKMPK